MLIIKDAMVIIHLAKMVLLERSCKLFGEVFIPPLVYKEVQKGESHHPEEVIQLKDLIKNKQIRIKEPKKSLIAKVNQYNVQRGEAEAVALYWQEKADLLATDDDNVRKKKDALQISTIGTPAIVIKLYRTKKIDKSQYLAAARKLHKVGWFSSTVFDRMLLEVEND